MLDRGDVDAAGGIVRRHAAENFQARHRVLAREIRPVRRPGVLVGLVDEAAHAARLGDDGGIEHVERPHHASGAGRVRIEMYVDIDGADQRRVGKAEIDRPAQRVDLPFIGIGCRRGAQAAFLAAAGAQRQPESRGH